uniref:ATP synthase F0 subunit 8 n=1 Tax=Mecidea indica TaxID=3127717 RepID=UPI0030DF4B67
MPQMAPMWWEILFIMFIMSFILMNIMMYFFNKMKTNMNKKEKSNNINQMNWMW